jgi:hypothetical protein
MVFRIYFERKGVAGTSPEPLMINPVRCVDGLPDLSAICTSSQVYTPPDTAAFRPGSCPPSSWAACMGHSSLYVLPPNAAGRSFSVERSQYE